MFFTTHLAPNIIIASGLASWGPKGPSSLERALTATGVSKERPKSNVYSVRLNISSSVFMGADILFPD